MHTINMHPQAIAAIRAAQNVAKWGNFAARRYAMKNSSLALYRLARQLEAASKI